MGRPRYQRGFVEETGKLVKKWKVHWYVWITDGTDEDRRHRSRVIGRKPSKNDRLLSAADAALPVLTKAEAQAELDRIIRVEVGGQEPRRDGGVLFGDFLRDRWLPLREPTWRANTKTTILAVIDKHVEPRWGRERLDAIDAPKASAWLGELAKKKYSASMLHKTRMYLRSVIQEAVEQGYLPKDPLRRVKRPVSRKRIDRSYLTIEQVWALRDEVRGFRDRLILDILLATGMRPGELFALRWTDIMEGALYVDEGFSRGYMEAPKTFHAIAAVAVPEEIMEQLAQWQRESNPTNPQGFIFPSEIGTPIYSENWRKRVLTPAAARAKVRATYQVIRRTVATLSIQDGVSVKAVQAQLRHSSAETTMNVYAQVVTAAQGAAAKQMFGLMKRKVVDPVEDGGDNEEK
jgi:integrase